MTAVDLSLFPQEPGTEAAVLGEPPTQCFYCGEAMRPEPAVIWLGYGHDKLMGLHWQCAMQFAAHLGHDAVDASNHRTVDKTDPPLSVFDVEPQR